MHFAGEIVINEVDSATFDVNFGPIVNGGPIQQILKVFITAHQKLTNGLLFRVKGLLANLTQQFHYPDQLEASAIHDFKRYFRQAFPQTARRLSYRFQGVYLPVETLCPTCRLNNVLSHVAVAFISETAYFLQRSTLSCVKKRLIAWG